ncbi:PREDICTED: glutamate receptor ionotropic, kainate 2-like [Atta cephalotes]|uniref:Ionotropic glutamate receptor C-terminal domain-containing protein n=1 Tax=Atta cephalotes TaxID=12957 RepID=A0A158NUD0_ATTCE|nr:PREDICTED: glutamate receptor ionotropic, kainate 2-like [Atta cephalotes]
MYSRQCLFSIALVLLVTTRIHGQMRPIKIGAIFHKGEEYLQSVFSKAISDTKNENHESVFELVAVTKYIEGRTDSFMTAIAACKLLEEGVAAIFGPSSRYTSGIVASIAARFDIPHIEYVWRESEGKENQKKSSSMTINIFPASEQVSQAIADIIDSMNWQKFAAIYETDEGLSRLQKTLILKGDNNDPIIHTAWKLEKGPDYRSMLREIRYLSVRNIIIDVKPENIMKVLYQAKEVSLLEDYSDFIITYLESSILPISDILSGTFKITGLSIRENDDIKGIDSLDSAILYDAVFLLHTALETLNARNIENEVDMSIDSIPLSCTNSTRKYQVGSNITSIMREISKRGKITGIMYIDEYGRRRDFNVKILNFRQSNKDIQILGYWDTFKGLHISHIRKKEDIYLYKRFMEEKIFKISVRESKPYIMEVIDGSTRGVLIGQKRYEGYCIDLINKIEKFLHFKGVVFEIVADNKQGNYDPQTKTWNGLISSILNHEADLAISDLMMTSHRKTVVDFSVPFMSTGTSIVFSKPEKQTSPFFPVLVPFSKEVWLYMAIASFLVSIMLFLQARMTSEWKNPHHLRNADSEENNFNLKNSFYFTISSFMQGGSNILLKTSSMRMLASIWWLFTLIMYSFYTAYLTAVFLTADKIGIPIKGIEDLARQTKIKYGALEGGETATFFKNSNHSTYKQMWAVMVNSRPSVFASSYEEGIDRVIKSKRRYAFLMESGAIEYYTARKCDIIKIGNVIGNRGYAIVMPRNSPYRIYIDHAILTLIENGVMEDLKKKWWQERGLCNQDEIKVDELGMTGLGGVFFVLICGCSASFFIVICEFLWNVHKVAETEKITLWKVLVAELKFTVNIFAIRKPVKIIKRSNSNISSKEDGLHRAASTA